MSLITPRCFERDCKNYIGTSGKTEQTQFVFCKAFGEDTGGIPDIIAYGDNLHLEPIKGQENDIVFEKA